MNFQKLNYELKHNISKHSNEKYPDYGSPFHVWLTFILLVMLTTTWNEILLSNSLLIPLTILHICLDICMSIECVYFCIQDKSEAKNKIHFGQSLSHWISDILRSVWKFYDSIVKGNHTSQFKKIKREMFIYCLENWARKSRRTRPKKKAAENLNLFVL